MKTVYQAANSLEAHMIVDLLRQQGLSGRVDGEYLQGGVGELPAAGLVRVVVGEDDFAAARALIEKWDAAQPAQPAAAAASPVRSRSGAFLFGLLAGIVACVFYYRTPVTKDGIDLNYDGVLDVRWNYAPGGRPTSTEYDRNLDGKVDLIHRFGRDGMALSSEADDDFDGIFESRTRFRDENPLVTETDSSGDGYPDLLTRYVDGVVSSIEYIDPLSGRPLRVEGIRRGKIVHADIDSNRDGVLDTRLLYDALGEVVARLALH